MGWACGWDEEQGKECMQNFGRETSWKKPTWKTVKEIVG
jgi:hypothetical protein